MNKAQKKIEEFILQQIENSTLPEWKCPWIARAKCNFITGHIYSGGNAALVAFNPNDFFMTFNQAKEIGYIKKGSHSLPIPFYKIIQDKEIKQTDHGIEIKEKTPRPILVSYYNVFGLNDIDITEEKKFNKLMSKRQKKFDHKPEPDIELFLTEIGANFEHSNVKAYHVRGSDEIFIPALDQFKSKENYYRTMFHEIGHWTGNAENCKRDKTGNKFGNAGYAKEELVAEIYSNYVAADYGFNVSEQSAAYIKNWLQAIKEKPFALMSAFTDAQKAYNWTIQKLLTV